MSEGGKQILWKMCKKRGPPNPSVAKATEMGALRNAATFSNARESGDENSSELVRKGAADQR